MAFYNYRQWCPCNFVERITKCVENELRKFPNVKKIKYSSYPPCKATEIAGWEALHGVCMPKDMAKFYMCTNGFNVGWTFQYSKNNSKRVGYINFPELQDIRSVRVNGPGKFFLLDRVPGQNANIYLVYSTMTTTLPEVYIKDMRTLEFIKLADSFTDYLRMTMMHFGLPCWQLNYLSCGLPPWIEHIWLIMDPFSVPYKPVDKKYDSPYNIRNQKSKKKNFTNW